MNKTDIQDTQAHTIKTSFPSQIRSVQFKTTPFRQKLSSFPHKQTHNFTSESHIVKSEDSCLKVPITLSDLVHPDTTHPHQNVPPPEPDTSATLDSQDILQDSSIAIEHSPRNGQTPTTVHTVDHLDVAQINWEEKMLQNEKRLERLSQSLFHLEYMVESLKERAVSIESQYCLIYNPLRLDIRYQFETLFSRDT